MKNNIFISNLMFGLFLSITALKPHPTPAQSTHHRLDTCATTGTTFTTEMIPKTGIHFRDTRVTNLLTFGLDHESKTQLTGHWKISVSLTIKTKDANEHALPIITTRLTLESDTNTNTLQDKDLYRSQGAYTMEVTLDSITLNGQPTGKLPSYVYLEADLLADRYYDFSKFVNDEIVFNTPALYNVDCDAANIMDEIELTWQMCYDNGTVAICPEEYQLEWTFVNDYHDKSGTYIAPENLLYDFKNNSTRVTLLENKYRLSLVYPHGYLLYRIRAIGHDMNDPTRLITGIWSVQNEKGSVSAVTSKFSITGEHEGDKNWQYSVNYAEEGKKKEVISYYDGSLHSRQELTKINTDTTTLVGSTVYDSQGRPAINVLPVPVTQNGCGTNTTNGALKYHTQFNRNEKGKLYSREDFDKDTSGNKCSVTAGKMSPLSGASNYYSPKNPGMDTLNATIDNYIPDAEDYPFSQTEYTPDNTGRIRKQSGVGKSLQLNGGHETKYFYGQPEQLELDRMFGSEAGDASHYKKNVTIDANGVTSVSYLDIEGRTIATALAGDMPVGSGGGNILEPLPSSDSAKKFLTTDLFAKDYYGKSRLNTVSQEGDAMVFNKQKLISYESDYTFEYSINHEPLNDPCVKNNVCFHCVYDLEIKITDECGNTVTPKSGSQPIQKMAGRFEHDSTGATIFISNCTDTLGNVSGNTATETFTLHLTPGNYTLKKILRINAEARKYYIDKYLEEGKNACLIPLQTFIDTAMAQMDTTGCNVDCESCVRSLGTRENWVSEQKGTESQYDFLVEQCLRPCKEISWCDLAYQQMLHDVSPGHQYGEYLVGDTLIYPWHYPLSVYNEDNELPENRTLKYLEKTWRHPEIEIHGKIYDYYMEEDGSPSVITVSVINSALPTDDEERYNIKARSYSYDVQKGNWYTTPASLKYVNDFIARWQNSWARSLVKYHPEYGYYESCRDYGEKHKKESRTSDEFDGLMNRTETFKDAQARGFIKSNGKVADFSIDNNTLSDPFMWFSSWYQNYPVPLEIDLHNEFQKKIYGYYVTLKGNPYTLEQLSAMMARCGTEYGTDLPGSVCTDFGAVTPGDTVLSDSIRNKEWNNFKNFYLSEKRKIQNKRGDELNLKTYRSYNGCIGNTDYEAKMLAEDYMESKSWTLKNEYEESQACGINTWEKYINKEKRFSDGAELEKRAKDAAYQMYLQTGQCPLATHLEFLLNALATKNELADSAVALRNYYEFTQALYQEINGNSIGKKYIPYLWSADTTVSDELKINIAADTSGVNSCTMTLNKTGAGINYWSDIKGIKGLRYRYRQNGIAHFTGYAMVKADSMRLIPKEITGSTCIPIGECNFQYTCDASDMGVDMMNLWNSLLREDKFNVCATDLENDSTLKLFITPAILNHFKQHDDSLFWCRNIPTQVGTGGFKEDTTFILYDKPSPTQKIEIKFTGFSPGNYRVTDLGKRIKSFSQIHGNYDNHFVMKGLDSAGNEIVVIEGEGVRKDIQTGKNEGIAMGYCGMPAEIGCQGLEYEVNRDLENLLKKVLTNYSCGDSIDLMAQVEMTRLLRTYIAGDSIPSASTCDTSNGKEILQFNLGRNQELILAHPLRTAKPYLRFKNLMEIGKLQTAQAMSGDGKFYHFFTLGKFKNPTRIFPVQDTIYGESFFPIRTCEDCEPVCNECTPELGNGNLISPDTCLIVCAGTTINFAPQFVGTGGLTCPPSVGKYANGIWYWGDTTASYNQTHTYTDTGEYNVTFLSKPPTNGCPYTASFERKVKVVYDTNQNGVCGDTLYTKTEDPEDTLDNECLSAWHRYIQTAKKFNQYVNSDSTLTEYHLQGIFTDSLDFTKKNLCYCVDKYVSMLSSIMSGITVPGDYEVWKKWGVLDIAVMCNTDKEPGCVPPPPDTLQVLPLIPVGKNPCVEERKELAIAYATYHYKQQVDSLTTEIAAKYNHHCVSAEENFTAKFDDKVYHYTLYYYDLAGNLIRTVPPEGVELLNITSHDNPLEMAIKKDRADNTHFVTTDHRMTSSYEFNSEGSVTKQSLPDHDKINLWEYDKTDGLDKRFIPTAVQFVQNGKGFLSGYIPSPMNTPAGCIYTTTDGGSTWEKVENISGTDISKVQMIDEQYGFAVGSEGKILGTYSGGTSWYDISGDAIEDLNDLYFKDLKNGIIVGNYGTIIRTNDGGTTFTKANGNYKGINFRSLTFIEGKYYTCGENVRGEGVIHTSQDGLNWTEMKNIGVEDLNTVHFVSLSTGYSAGNDGNLLKTIDRGNTWKLVSTNLNNSFRKIYFKNEREGMAIIDEVVNQIITKGVFTTMDSGKNWKKLSNNGENFNNFQFYEGSKGYVTGNQGVIKRVLLENSYGLMNIQFKGSQDLTSVYFLNNKEGWVSANNKLFYTENTDSVTVVWTEHPHNAGIFKKIFFIDRNTGIGLNGLGELFKIIYSDSKKIYECFKLSGTDVFTDFTTGSVRIFLLHKDGRLGYIDKNNLSNTAVINYLNTKVGIPPKKTIEISLPADTLMITVGKTGEIIRGKINSNDVSWFNVSYKIKPLPLKDIVAFKKDEITVIGNNGMVLRTTDGNKWKKLSTDTKINLKAITGNSQTEGLLCGEKGNAWKYDFNATKMLQEIGVTGTTDLQDVLILDNGKAYATGDKGEVWFIENISAPQITLLKSVPEPIETNFNGISKIKNSQTIIAVGGNGSIYQYNSGSGAKINEVYPGRINGLHFSDTRNGHAVGDKGLMLQTKDGGITWKPIKRKIVGGITVPDLYAVWTESAGKAYIAGGKRFLGKIEGNMVKKVFGGGNAIEKLKDIEMQKNGNGFIVGENGLCYKTKDGGLTWKLEKDGPDNFNTVHVFRDGGMLAAGEAGAVKYFSGTRWKMLTPPNSSEINFKNLYFHDDKNGYLVGSGGKILKILVDGKSPEGIKWIAKENATEMEVADLNQLDIGVIGFSGRFTGFISGFEEKNNSKENYSRTLHDESEIYSGYFWYDRVGRLILSQNTKQFNQQPKRYSYILYDDLGRIAEVGEKIEKTDKNSLKFKDIFGTFASGKYQPAVIDDAKYNTWLISGMRLEVVHTYYDMTKIDNLPMVQDNLRNRIASVTIEEKDDGNEQTYNHATHYSYDIHGNVKTLIQDNPTLPIGTTYDTSLIALKRYMRMDYEYDLISGKVNAVHYQNGQPDAFHHKYVYDADNRLTNVLTSKDNVIFDQDAKYFYYKHGPLARTELGDLKVQGIDYAYTLQGWLKGVNSETGAMIRDMGKDGLSGTVNGGFANDVYGYSLTYYEGDYKPIGVTNSSNHFLANKTNSDFLNSRHDLFNGNISAMVTTLTEPKTGISKPQGTAYKYDPLNRLVEMKAWQNIDVATNKWGSGTVYNGLYHNTFSYDGNGNIVTQERKDENGKAMDELMYRYHNLGGKKIQNRLYQVNDSVGATNNLDDIDDQGTFTTTIKQINTKNNYSYDELGNLRKDSAEKIKELKWTVAGKVKEINRYAGSGMKNLRFDYDALGNRIAKHVYSIADVWENTTYYVRDASGNIMSVYEYKNDAVTQKVYYTQVERHIYGSARLGVDKSPVELIGAVALDTSRYTHTLGWKGYELGNHLGNVMVVVSDRKMPVVVGGVFDHWGAEVGSGTDYYPGGMGMPGRNFNSTNYSFGWQGQLSVDEISGVKNHYHTENWEYDPRTLRRWEQDPLQSQFPGWSPYSTLFNNPINLVDPTGLAPTDFKDKDGNTISHVEDGSNAVFQLKGTDQTNERFEFTGYNNQGGKNEVSVEGAITGAQDYVTNNCTKCNQSVNFVGRTYESAVKAQGNTVDNIGIVTGNSLAGGITSDLTSKVTAETSVATAQESAAKGNLVVGANGGHVVTMTTKSFDVTRYNASGSIIEKKQIGGGKITNVNGSYNLNNIGPGQINSFQNPKGQPTLIWYSLPAK